MRAWRLLVNLAAWSAVLAVLWVAWNWARLSVERAELRRGLLFGNR